MLVFNTRSNSAQVKVENLSRGVKLTLNIIAGNFNLTETTRQTDRQKDQEWEGRQFHS